MPKKENSYFSWVMFPLNLLKTLTSIGFSYFSWVMFPLNLLKTLIFMCDLIWWAGGTPWSLCKIAQASFLISPAFPCSLELPQTSFRQALPFQLENDMKINTIPTKIPIMPLGLGCNHFLSSHASRVKQCMLCYCLTCMGCDSQHQIQTTLYNTTHR